MIQNIIEDRLDYIAEERQLLGAEYSYGLMNSELYMKEIMHLDSMSTRLVNLQNKLLERGV